MPLLRLSNFLYVLGYSATAVCAGSIPLDISAHYNNKAFGTHPGEASFDGLGQSYPPPRTAHTPFYTSITSGIVYSFPGYTDATDGDNLICRGQTIAIPNQHANTSIFSVSFLVAGDVEFATVRGNVTFEYTDGTISLYELRALGWFSWLTLNKGELVFPFRFTPDGVNWNTSTIFERTAPLVAGKKLRSLILPDVSSLPDGRLHLFAVSLWGSDETVQVGIQAVRPTQKWLSVDEQVVEISVNNAGAECLAGPGVTVTLVGSGFETTTPGRLRRLCSGDQKIVKIGVRGSSGGAVDASVIVDGENGRRVDTISDVEIGLTDWTPEPDNLARHEAPDWFDGAKFGIFIHWGVYAVTGWGNSTPHESYAEWFWWYSTHHPQADPSGFYDYRLRTYGPDWAYDDTFPYFTASRFDPKEWVDLFADAGAQYFVITSKHHDGFALFDTGKTSNRSSLHYGPHRDLLLELFDAAAIHQPSLKRGTYFSLPEWYNPDFGPYGFDQLPAESVPGTNSWPGVPARNPCLCGVSRRAIANRRERQRERERGSNQGEVDEVGEDPDVVDVVARGVAYTTYNYVYKYSTRFGGLHETKKDALSPQLRAPEDDQWTTLCTRGGIVVTSHKSWGTGDIYAPSQSMSRAKAKKEKPAAASVESRHRGAIPSSLLCFYFARNSARG
ncbi:hypothetical protein NUW58_g2464 [Xylaria curta]|uniref:Uncharacterized protein n=1 Tax=Xylaria curta TaxID=42375 RepID=A0ACC1PFE3_9PEZI|nr:hypothetical protein NUW58_g2464 [Xylaria curta]